MGLPTNSPVPFRTFILYYLIEVVADAKALANGETKDLYKNVSEKDASMQEETIITCMYVQRRFVRTKKRKRTRQRRLQLLVSSTSFIDAIK